MVDSSVIGIQLQGASVFTLRSSQVQIHRVGETQDSMRISQRFVELQSALRRGPGFRSCFLTRNFAEVRQDGIGFCQAGVSGSVAWIAVDRLLEIRNCFS